MNVQQGGETMPLKRNLNFDIFSEILTSLNQEIALSGKLNLLSKNIHAEYFYRDLLNLLYGYNLRNENDFDPNSDAIDLIDTNKLIVVQVSSTCTKSKMEKTLKKSRVEILAKENYSLKFVFIGNQNINSKGWNPINPHHISFLPNDDVLLTQDLSRKFLSLSIIEQEEIISFLYKETGVKFKITDDLIDSQLSASINSLGPRYTPEVNVQTENSLIFETMINTEQFWKTTTKLICSLISAFSKLRKAKYEMAEAQKYVNTLVLSTEKDYKQLTTYNNELSEESKANLLLAINGSLQKIIDNCETFPIFTSNLDSQTKDELVHKFRNIEKTASNLSTFLEQTKFELLINPYLLICGEAGIGKSHLLADFCTKARNEGHSVFLFLGQHFISDEDPWAQILKFIAPNTSPEEFVNELVRHSKTHSKKVFLVIDALNEGEGRRLWPNYFQRFFELIRKYKDIHFVFSVRSTFLSEIIPEYVLITNNIIKYDHTGFENSEFDAINSYCSFYNLLPPAFPMLDEEFQNPLFLKLVCSMLSKKGATRLERGYTLDDVYSSYIIEINNKLAEINYLDFDHNINLVKIVIYVLISEIDKTVYGQIDYQSAYKVVNSSANEYCDKSRHFLSALIDQNILQENTNYKGENFITFTYEKMGDYYRAEWLLKNYSGGQGDNIITALRDDIQISKYLTDESTISFNNGIIEMISILLPIKLDIELFEVIATELKSDHNIIDAFLKSLYWRKVQVINPSQKEYIKEVVLKYKYSWEKFIDVLIDLSFDAASAFNANALDRFLKGMPLKFRDAYWTTYISVDFTSTKVEKYISWIWNNYADLTADSIELIETTLMWFLSSTNRRLRDFSTKTLSCLFIQRPETAYSILKNSIEVDDPYIIERLFAALFGAFVHSSGNSSWRDTVLSVYETVFDQEQTLPNIMIRDYARSIIEYAVTINMVRIDEVEAIYQPYKSKWYHTIPDLSEIDKVQNETDQMYKKHGKESSGVYHILHSMTTEYGRGTGAYGDFGRYTFGSALHDWNNQFNDQDLSNIVVKEIFDKFYDIDLHSDFDYKIGRNFDRHDHRIERLGKKYQWIGFFELLARLGDNYPPYKEIDIYKPEYNAIEEQRLNKFLAFIKHEEFYEEHETQTISYPDLIDDAVEDDSKYIERTEKQPIGEYDRPWKFYIRDIDPTYIWNKITTKKITLLPNFWSAPIGLEWVNSNSIYDDLAHYREFEIGGKIFISLYSFWNKIRNPDDDFRNRDSITFLSGSLFINNADSEKFLDKKKLINGNGVPELSYSNCFLHEYHWSSTCHVQQREYDADNSEDIKMIIGTNKYLWESSSDESLPNNESVHAVLPNSELVKFFELHQVGIGEWKNSDLETVCFDSAQLGYSEQHLLFDKEKLFQYLNFKNSTLIWGEYFEKIASNQHHEWWIKTNYEGGSFTKHIYDERKWKNDKW